MYVERLKDAVSIQSVSAWPEKRDEIVKMVKHVAGVSFYTAGISPKCKGYTIRVYVSHTPLMLRANSHTRSC